MHNYKLYLKYNTILKVYQVAASFMNDDSFKLEATPEIKKELVDVMGQVQDMVSEVCDQYFDRFRRRCHVTPKSYLSFLTGYKSLYAQKLVKVSDLRDRMKTGLEKLAEAEESVNELSIELEQKEKDLEVASAEAEVVLKEVTQKVRLSGHRANSRQGWTGRVPFQNFDPRDSD